MSPFKLLQIALPSILATATKPLVGGQAVIEGVMMRSANSFAVAVRGPDQTIVVRERQWLSFSQHFKFLRWPILRGATMLVESMYNGLSALQFSAEQSMASGEKKADADAPEAKGKSKVDLALLATMGVSMLLGIALFKAVPHLIAFGLGELWGHDGQSALPITSAGFHLVDGAVKMVIFVGYILLISRMPDVKRIFMYHGAEHKAVHAFEKGLALDVAETRIQPTAHPRCGTSLILLVITVSIVIFAAVLPLIPQVSDVGWVQSLFSLVIKIPLMLPIAGVAYEFQRAAAKHPNNLFIKAFIAPGMLMQRLTTTEPTDDQLEVSLTALRKTVWRENLIREALESPVDQLEVYANFADAKQALA